MTNSHASRESARVREQIMATAAAHVPPEEDDSAASHGENRLGAWAESLARPAPDNPRAAIRSGSDLPARKGFTRPRQPSYRFGLRLAVGACVFGASLGLGISVFLFQLRPALLATPAVAILLQSVVAFATILLLSLVLFRLMALDRRLDPHQPVATPDTAGLAASLGELGRIMDEIDQRCAVLETRLADVANALDWASRKNLAALQNVTAAIAAEGDKLAEAGATSEATLHRVLEAAQLLTGVVRTSGDCVWTVASENDFTLDAKTRYMAERLRYDLRTVVDDTLTDFETRARAILHS